MSWLVLPRHSICCELGLSPIYIVLLFLVVQLLQVYVKTDIIFYVIVISHYSQLIDFYMCVYLNLWYVII